MSGHTIVDPCQNCGASIFDHEPIPTSPAGPPYTRGGVTPTPAYLAICEDTGIEALVPAGTTSCDGYVAPGRTREADITGGLEVRKSHAGRWAILLPEGEPIWDLTQPRKRNAVAARELLLAAMPDWTGVTPDGALPDGSPKAEVRRVARTIRRVTERRTRGLCLGCGTLPAHCCCGTDQQPGGPHYTAAEIAWAR